MSKLVFDSDRMMQLAGLRDKPRDPDEYDGRPVQGTAHLWQVKTCSGTTLTIATAENDMQQLAAALKLVELTSDVSSVEHTGECLGLFELKDEKTIERLVKLNKLESGRHDDAGVFALSTTLPPAPDKCDAVSAVEAIKRGAMHNIEFLQRITVTDPKTVHSDILRTALVMLDIDYTEVRKVEGLTVEPEQAGYETIAGPVQDPTHRAWAQSVLAVLWSRSRSLTECSGSDGGDPGYHAETAAQTTHDHSHVLRTLDRLPPEVNHDGWGCNGAA